MKASPAIDPLAAFPDAARMPGDVELAAALGTAFPPVRLILDRLQAAHPEATSTWQYTPRSGWYRMHLLKKRRLLYLIPKRGDYHLMFILGGKALARLQAGPFAGRVAALVKSAKRYPEGTVLKFDRTSTDPDLLAAVLEAKVSPAPHRP